MNLILLTPGDLVGPDRAVLAGRRCEHAAGVLKLNEGDRCRVGMLNGRLGTGEVLRLDRARGTIELAFSPDREPPPPLPLALLAALPRPKSFRKVLHGAVTLGIKRLCFVNSAKVEKSYWQSPFLREEQVKEATILALEQAVDTVMPEVIFRPRFKPFVEDEFGAWAGERPIFLAHPGAALACPANLTEPAVLCLGPEGGFTDYEVGKLEEAGGVPVSLGVRILRTEYALPAAAGRLCGG